MTDEHLKYDISAMVGRTPTSVEQTDEEITFQFSDGSKCKFYHSQNCCESVVVEDVTGDWTDLIGHPILVAEERVSASDDGEIPDGLQPRNESDTWTFYTFRGIGGTVDVRWHGSSNGYYSESVDFWFQEAAEVL